MKGRRTIVEVEGLVREVEGQPMSLKMVKDEDR
jgi:hypothetical protein